MYLLTAVEGIGKGAGGDEEPDVDQLATWDNLTRVSAISAQFLPILGQMLTRTRN